MGLLRYCKKASKAYRTVMKFENRFAKISGHEFAVAVNSGYSALYLALLAHGIGRGDEVIVPEFTMIATANAVKATGAKPVFCEVDKWGLIDVSKAKITEKTKAIMPVHIYGNTVNVDEFALNNDLIVIEDAAEVHGGLFTTNTACYSFYSNKIIQTGEGGIICTNDPSVAERARALRTHGDQPAPYFHSTFGYSFRMNGYGAKHGLKELRIWRYLVWRRKLTARIYKRFLNVETLYRGNVCWLYPVVFRDLNEKYTIKGALYRAGFETRQFFFPMGCQPIYNGRCAQKSQSNKLSAKGLLLPTINLGIIKQLKVIKIINNEIKKGRA